ncbi:MAG: winged helix-turn-helix transcriptional regulator [Acidimicrobiales bacterium]
MSKRTYRQYCGLAAALDVVGQRWALLIVRDLVPGPRRFTDLFDGLPGISTDLLADRLRSLEGAGAVRQREVRNPAPANLYELTERGQELARLAGDLARWGGPLLPPVDDAGDHVINGRWTLTQRAARYRGGFPDGDVHILLDHRDELTLSFTGDRARLAYGHLSAEPIMVIEATTAAILALLRRTADDDADLDDDLSVAGRTDLLRPLLFALNS